VVDGILGSSLEANLQHSRFRQDLFLICVVFSKQKFYTAFCRLMKSKKWGAGAMSPHPPYLTRVKKAILF